MTISLTKGSKKLLIKPDYIISTEPLKIKMCYKFISMKGWTVDTISHLDYKTWQNRRKKYAKTY